MDIFIDEINQGTIQIVACWEPNPGLDFATPDAHFIGWGVFGLPMLVCISLVDCDQLMNIQIALSIYHSLHTSISAKGEQFLNIL